MPPRERRVGLILCMAAVLLSGGMILWIGLPPPADVGSPAGSGRRTETPPFEIRIAHDDDGCADLLARKPCRQDPHWKVLGDGRPGMDLDDLRSALRREADRARSGLPDPSMSERHVVVRGPETAPWGLVQRFMNEAAKVGIARIDWAVVEREKNSIVQAWLPSRKKDSLNAIPVFLKWDPTSGITLRKVANRGMVDSDGDLMSIVLQMATDFRNAGQGSVPVLIDATPDVPWRDVIHVMNLCRKENVEAIEFAAPFTEKR